MSERRIVTWEYVGGPLDGELDAWPADSMTLELHLAGRFHRYEAAEKIFGTRRRPVHHLVYQGEDDDDGDDEGWHGPL